MWLLWKRALRTTFANVVWENWHKRSLNLVWKLANLSDEALISLLEQVGEHPASPPHTHLGCVAFALISLMIFFPFFFFLETVKLIYHRWKRVKKSCRSGTEREGDTWATVGTKRWKINQRFPYRREQLVGLAHVPLSGRCPLREGHDAARVCLAKAQLSKTWQLQH